MISYQKMNVGRLVLAFKPVEYKWVTNMLRAAHQHIEVRKFIVGGSDTNMILSHRLSKKLKSNHHSTGSFIWTLNIVKLILRNDMRVIKHKSGAEYEIFPSPRD